MKGKSEFDKFLEGLTDHELSIFITYRYYGFLENSRKKIMDEIKKRKLTKEQLIELHTQPLNLEIKTKLCQRCGSDKVFTETDIEQKPTRTNMTREVAIDTTRCRLCGYNPAKESPKNLLDRIKRIFKNHTTERTIRIFDWTGDRY